MGSGNVGIGIGCTNPAAALVVKTGPFADIFVGSTITNGRSGLRIYSSPGYGVSFSGNEYYDAVSLKRVHAGAGGSISIDTSSGSTGGDITFWNWVNGAADSTLSEIVRMKLLQNGNLTMEASGGGYYSASTHQWTNGSSARIKQDVAPNEMDVLGILDGLEVVNSRYRSEVETDPAAPYHIGFIAEDAPELLTGKAHDGMATGDCIGFLLGVVKEQQKTIDALSARLDALEKGR
jgi:hypothetical protein